MDAVEDAERWGEAALQPLPRNIFRWCVARNRELRRSLAETTGMPLPWLAANLTQPVGWYFARVVSAATDESIRAQLAALPEQLDHVDGLIGAEVIGGKQPNAADFQIGTSVRVLLNFPQLRVGDADRTPLRGLPADQAAARVGAAASPPAQGLTRTSHSGQSSSTAVSVRLGAAAPHHRDDPAPRTGLGGEPFRLGIRSWPA